MALSPDEQAFFNDASAAGYAEDEIAQHIRDKRSARANASSGRAMPYIRPGLTEDAGEGPTFDVKYTPPGRNLADVQPTGTNDPLRPILADQSRVQEGRSPYAQDPIAQAVTDQMLMGAPVGMALRAVGAVGGKLIRGAVARSAARGGAGRVIQPAAESVVPGATGSATVAVSEGPQIASLRSGLKAATPEQARTINAAIKGLELKASRGTRYIPPNEFDEVPPGSLYQEAEKEALANELGLPYKRGVQTPTSEDATIAAPLRPAPKPQVEPISVERGKSSKVLADALKRTVSLRHGDLIEDAAAAGVGHLAGVHGLKAIVARRALRLGLTAGDELAAQAVNRGLSVPALGESVGKSASHGLASKLTIGVQAFRDRRNPPRSSPNQDETK